MSGIAIEYRTMPGKKATLAPCSSAWSWPMTPSISSEANTSPGTRMPGLYGLGKSHRWSSIFSRMFFQLETMAYHLIFRHVWLAAALRPCTLDIEKHLSPVSAVLGGHLQHVPGYRLHPQVESGARWGH